MKNTLIRRDPKIDILRAIAIICILVAHSSPNEIIFQVRNFDVVLMVLLLGHSFYVSSTHKKIEYYQYVKKRFRRLVVPTWVFLSVFFCLFYLIALILDEKYYFSYFKILNSYTLLNGIGFVWIIKVFFLVALISPFILKISEKIKDNKTYFLLLLGSYLLYTLLLVTYSYLSEIYVYLNAINSNLDGMVRLVFTEVIVYGLGYGIIVAFGIRLAKMSRKEITVACLIFFATFLGLSLLHAYAPTQNFKYPPRLYYLSYGLFASLLLYRLLDISVLQKLFATKLVDFTSKNSDWIYYWHIIFVYVIKLFGDAMPFVADSLLGRFLFIFAATLFVTYTHQTIKLEFKRYFSKQQKLTQSKLSISRTYKTN